MSRNYDQQIGFSLGGFTVGHRATVGFTKAIATIVGIKDVGDRCKKVTIEFDDPQPVDAPEGTMATRFELDCLAIQSTWFEPEAVVFNEDVRYVVKDEHTLGFIFDVQPGLMGVLSSTKGGHHPNGGPVSIFGADILPATVEDFETFRVKIPPNFKESKP